MKKSETRERREEIREWGTEQSPVSGLQSFREQRLVSYSLPITGLSAMGFLRHAEGQERFFWEDVRDRITLAGFGSAANLMGWGDGRYAHIRQQAQTLFQDAVLLGDAPELARPRLFGGFAFRDDFLPDNTWAAFQPAHFILPHYQFVRVGQETWLTINALIPLADDPEHSLPILQEALQTRRERLLEPGNWRSETPPQTPASSLQSLSYPMSPDEWALLIHAVQQEIATTELKKVVLARVCEARFHERIDIYSALAFLNKAYADCYRFVFEPRPFHTFLGATPELLAKVEGATLTTMSLAGSIRRSADPLEDAALGQQLMESPKDRHEHEVVVMSILGRLAPLTTQLEISPAPGVYKLSNIQHLFTPIRGALAQPDGILPLVEALHPTPAMGGSPRSLALDFISRQEPMPRGWYASPVGWIDYKLDGAFAVGIRSAVVQERRAWLYAGAGIVAASDPDQEWAETGLKFRPMQNALGIISSQ
ncbi:MAG: isochorismate synthase [Chloroflexi bacterium]|nr:isochorismate synthase [Chloroflexota bacterium]MBP7045380.1 isochorismate synthase [Chloroflexota bacterium]